MDASKEEGDEPSFDFPSDDDGADVGPMPTSRSPALGSTLTSPNNDPFAFSSSPPRAAAAMQRESLEAAAKPASPTAAHSMEESQVRPAMDDSGPANTSHEAGGQEDSDKEHNLGVW